MIERIGRIGRAPERLVYRDLRLERKGFLSLFSFAFDDVPHRYDGMARGEAVIVLPIDTKHRQLYMLREIRPLTVFARDPQGKEALARLMRGEQGVDFEVSAESARMYELPAGMIDGNETPEEAAVRELREETGLTIDATRLHRVVSAFPTIGGSIERVHLFIAEFPETHAADRQAAEGDGGEEIEILKMSWDDAFALVTEGKLEALATGLLLRELMIRDMRHSMNE